MSLRYRLFLWVSTLFLLTAIIASFIESVVTKNALKKAKKNLYNQILESKEAVRKNLQDFLSYQIIENQAKIDLLLNTLSFSKDQLVKIAPTLENFNKGTWMACADILQNNRWIDFIQNTNEGCPTAVIVPESPPFPHAFSVPIDDDLSWVVYSEEKERTSLTNYSIYLGVRIFAIEQEYPHEQIEGEEIAEFTFPIPETYLLFPWKMLKETDFSNSQDASKVTLSPPWIQGHEIHLDSFLKAMERASAGLKKGSLTPPIVNIQNMEARIKHEGVWEEMLINPFPNSNMLTFLPKEKFLLEKMNDLSMANGEINILWIILSLFDSDLFGENSSLPLPVAVSTFKKDYTTGPAAMIKNLLYSRVLFDDAQFFTKNAPPTPQTNVATTLAIIHPENLPHVYLGNTAQFIVRVPNEKRVGYLTIGCDVDIIMQNFVLALHQSMVLVTGGKIASAFSADEKKIVTNKEQDKVLSALLDKNVGILPWDGKEFFFMHLIPFPSLDLHFFLFNPTENEFALLHNLEEGAQHVVHTILINIQIYGFAVLLLAIISLHYFSKSITAPIIQLAQSTKDIKEGNLDRVQISPPSSKRRDEIAILCQSFNEMVEGLKEKEKVKGILNKVVSQEIAKEILSGQVHLGGEEKKVTVLFADIRNFTDMTQTMMPHQVIELLNKCMTKISSCIDHLGGVIDKYVGDEAMALFGVPVFKEDHALRAVKSALEMVEVLKEWNKDRIINKEPLVEMGIGIHTGEMLVGNMGAENRLNYTVIGSNVNLASRICAAAKGMEILISKETLQESGIKDSIVYQEMEPILLKGFKDPIILYRVIGQSLYRT